MLLTVLKHNSFYDIFDSEGIHYNLLFNPLFLPSNPNEKCFKHLIHHINNFSRQALPVVTAMFEFIRDFEGEVPGAAARDCGNYLDMNLPMARYLASQYLERALLKAGEENLNYPE